MASSYRDHPDAPRPLIDLIPSYRDVEASDEEDDFYSKEEDRLLPAQLQALITQTQHRVPRRIQRCAVIVAALAVAYLVAWLAYFGPLHNKHKQEIHDMDNPPQMVYGANVLPDFTGLTKVKNMPAEHLPAKGNRLVFVGDVHGCRKELEKLLDKVAFNDKHDHLVLTGDMIAKGPDSPGVIRLAAKLGASAVRGNWEDKLLLSLAEQEDTHLSELPGPYEDPDRPHDTLDEISYSHGDYELRRLAKSFDKKDIAYLKSLPVILRIGSVPHLGSLVAVHAGLVPDIPLENQDPFHVMNMRTINLKTRIPSSKHGAGTPWEKFWNHRQEKLDKEDRVTVVYGHNRKKGLNVKKYSFGLDTGCVNGDKLTALVVNDAGETEIVQVKCKKHK